MNERRLSQNWLHLCRTGISRRGATNWVRKVYTTTPSKATPLFTHAGVTILEPSVFAGSGIVSPRECIAVQSALFKTTGTNQPISPLHQKLPPLTRQKTLKSCRRQYWHHIDQVPRDHSSRTKNLDINSCKLKKYPFLKYLDTCEDPHSDLEDRYMRAGGLVRIPWLLHDHSAERGTFEVLGSFPFPIESHSVEGRYQFEVVFPNLSGPGSHRSESHQPIPESCILGPSLVLEDNSFPVG